jgi:hypothetical protein
MFIKKIITICTLFMVSNVYSDTVIGRYDFTERLSNCQKLEGMSASDGLLTGVTHTGSTTSDTASLSGFITACLSSGNFNSFSFNSVSSIYSDDVSSRCSSERVSNSGCEYSLSTGVDGESKLGKAINPGKKGVALFTCNNGVWSISPTIRSCLDSQPKYCENTTLTWSGNKECHGETGKGIVGSEKRIVNYNHANSGELNISCTSTGWTQMDYGKKCDFSCSDIIGSKLNWSKGGYNCSGESYLDGQSGKYMVKAKIGEKQFSKSSDTSKMIFIKGGAEIKCSNGTWLIANSLFTCESAQNSDLSCTPHVVKRKRADGSTEDQISGTSCDWL